MSQVTREDTPECFGRRDQPEKKIEGWNPSCPSCAGGIDPAWTDKKTGSHVREKCLYFQSCGTLVQAQRMAQQPTLINPNNLVRPTLQQPQVPQVQNAYQQQTQVRMDPAQQAAVLHQQQVNAVAAQLAQLQRAMPHPQMQMHVPMGQQPAMHMGYQPMMPVNYHMPSYLSAPEPAQPGSFWGAFFVTILRSMGKSAGHSIAFMFDSVPLTGVTPPAK